jgi:glycosyltransferase involved in cell wall biosynthesis
MRVLHVSPTHFSPGSVLAGAERYSYGLCKAMSRVVPTTLVTFGDKPFETRDGELTIRCYRRWAYVKGQRTNPFALDFTKDILSADVVHCHQFKVVASDVAILGAALARKRVFVTDLGGSGFSLSYHLPLWKFVRSFLLISEFNRTLFADLPVSKKIIYGGVDTDRFRPGSIPRTNRILFVGRLMEHKGVHLLIDALGPDMELDVVGQATDPEYVARLRTAASGKRVRFHEDFADDRLLEAYQTAAVVAIPSLVDGGYTTALEAMACETPVVATAVGSMPELVEDGETGFIVPHDGTSAMRGHLGRLLAAPSLGRTVGAAGRKRVEALFTWERVVARCLAEYTS